MIHPDKNTIRRSALTIYDRIPSGRPDLYIASKKLEKILKESLVGLSLSGLALRGPDQKLLRLKCANQ